jgi:hypothetical protein
VVYINIKPTVFLLLPGIGEDRFFFKIKNHSSAKKSKPAVGALVQAWGSVSSSLERIETHFLI